MKDQREKRNQQQAGNAVVGHRHRERNVEQHDCNAQRELHAYE